MKHRYLHSLAPVLIDEAGLRRPVEVGQRTVPGPELPLPFRLNEWRYLLRYVALRRCCLAAIARVLLSRTN